LELALDEFAIATLSFRMLCIQEGCGDDACRHLGTDLQSSVVVVGLGLLLLPQPVSAVDLRYLYHVDLMSGCGRVAVGEMRRIVGCLAFLSM
jgi:hypothetical protein